ncbi:MAG: hypothetical protein KGL46_11705 [Hyphomicrobiales bacterium]|nr:hypothetical protein [Hyphomicrobiales bacterium]
MSETLAEKRAHFAPSWVLAIIVGAMLAWRILVHTGADFFAADDPARAIGWEPGNPAALTLLARDNLEKPDEIHSRAALDYATRLLLRDPLADGALAMVGLAVSALGDQQRAARIMATAGAHGPTDLASHAWLYEQALKRGDEFAALSELDILLRGRPGIAGNIGGSVVALIGRDPQSEAQFVKLLAQRPPWRPYLLQYLSNNLPDHQALVRLFARLQESPAPPTSEDVAVMLARLVRDRDYDAAYFGWFNALPKDRLSKLGMLYNGSFEYPLTKMPFDWEFASTPAATFEVAQDGDERALKVEFYGVSQPFANVSHLLALAPGNYAFSGLARTEGFEAPRGLRWRIFCVAAQGAAPVDLGATDLLTKSGPPQQLKATFTVPATGCSNQTLILEIPARIASEQGASGIVAFSKMAINPAP